MSKKEICLNNESFAYYSGFGGLEFKKIEYGINDFIYCVSGAWGGKKSYHKLKINHTITGNAFVTLHGYRIPLNECLKMGL